MSASRHSRVYLFVRPLLLIEIVVLALFVAGPRAGSLDVDGDGIPDVPIVVTASGPVATIPRPTARNAGAGQVRDAETVAVDGLRSVEIGNHDRSHRPGRPGLLLFCLLRC